MKELNITSLNAATYVTIMTGEKAEIVVDPKTQKSRFKFIETEDTLNRFREYRDAVIFSKQEKNSDELSDVLKYLMEYNKVFFNYREKSRELIKTS